MLRLLIAVLVVGMMGFVSVGSRAAGQELSTPAVVEKVEPCVYRVRVQGTMIRERTGDKGIKVEKKFDSTGTGFAVVYFGMRPSLRGAKKPAVKPTTLGYVVTNSHVVVEDGFAYAADAPPTIRLRNEKYEVDLIGELAGHDPLSDLAVIRVTDGPATNSNALQTAPGLFDGGRLRVLRFADRATVKAGQDVVAVGFALAINGTPTVSKGIVSALGRTHANGDFAGLIQTDAGINKGNSGGPLLNARGEVVGVNTYSRPAIVELRLDLKRLRELVRDEKTADSVTIRGNTVIIKAGSDLVVGGPVEGAQGINFARSCESAQPVVARLIGSGKVQRRDYGLVPLSRLIDSDDVANLGLRPGVILNSVRPGSPAAKAGLRAGDIVTEIEGRTIRSVGDVNNALVDLSEKTEVAVKFVRPSLISLRAFVKGRSPLDAEERERAIREQLFKSATLKIDIDPK
jgi:S1-C subfamily serine protease